MRCVVPVAAGLFDDDGNEAVGAGVNAGRSHATARCEAGDDGAVYAHRGQGGCQ